MHFIKITFINDHPDYSEVMVELNDGRTIRHACGHGGNTAIGQQRCLEYLQKLLAGEVAI